MFQLAPRPRHERGRETRLGWYPAALAMVIAACVGPQSEDVTDAPTTTPTPTASAAAPTTAAAAATTSAPSCEDPVIAASPPARGYAPMVSLGAEGGVMLTGGETAPPPLGGEVLTDTWTLSSSGWTNLTRCPSPPWGEAAYDAESDLVILLGGVREGWSDVRELWSFDPATHEWRSLQLDGGPRGWGHLAYDAESDRIIAFDGGETWAYDYNSNTWEDMQPEEDPPVRQEFAMAYDSESDRVILFGGYSTGELADTWAYDYNTNTWTEMAPSLAPSPRDFHDMVYVPGTDRIILYGGGDNVGHDDTWAYDHNTNTWTEMAPEFSPGIRSWHSMAYDDASGMVVLFGGAPRRDPLFHNDTWLYDPVADSWSPLGAGVIAGVTLSEGLASEGCEYAGPSKIPAGSLTLRLRNKTVGHFDLDVWALDEGAQYEQLADHIDEERRRIEEGETPLGHPTFASLTAQETADPQTTQDLVIEVGPGLYGLACLQLMDGGLAAIWAAGPIEVVAPAE